MARSSEWGGFTFWFRSNLNWIHWKQTTANQLHPFSPSAGSTLKQMLSPGLRFVVNGAILILHQPVHKWHHHQDSAEVLKPALPVHLHHWAVNGVIGSSCRSATLPTGPRPEAGASEQQHHSNLMKAVATVLEKCFHGNVQNGIAMATVERCQLSPPGQLDGTGTTTITTPGPLSETLITRIPFLKSFLSQQHTIALPCSLPPSLYLWMDYWPGLLIPLTSSPANLWTSEDEEWAPDFAVFPLMFGVVCMYISECIQWQLKQHLFLRGKFMLANRSLF